MSDRDGKLLQIVEDDTGYQFVTRSFGPDLVRNIEEKGIKFPDAYRAMCRLFPGIGIDVLPSHLLTMEGGNYPYVMVSEIITDGRPVVEASLEQKKELAKKLGRLPTQTRYLARLEMFRPDSFLLSGQGEEARIILTDLDPKIQPRPPIDNLRLFPWREQNVARLDSYMAHYIDEIAEIFWDDWCKPDEREAVLSALANSVGNSIIYPIFCFFVFMNGLSRINPTNAPKVFASKSQSASVKSMLVTFSFTIKNSSSSLATPNADVQANSNSKSIIQLKRQLKTCLKYTYKHAQ
jgi:hypothetical protein